MLSFLLCRDENVAYGIMDGSFNKCSMDRVDPKFVATTLNYQIQIWEVFC
jgi:hypothetical protein